MGGLKSDQTKFLYLLFNDFTDRIVGFVNHA